MTNKAINAIRFLGVDAINKANSGHPGIVLGAAPMAYQLFTEHLNIDVKHPKWINRDRFILSAGHGSMLLYALNHLIGYKLSMDDLKNFRQIGKTPGHPEYGHTEGVETTSGPLGQGISNGVGMALAETHLAARFNKENFPIFDHYTYVLCGDGDLQEGVALEASSLAGHLGLGKLIVLYDSNDVQLDGPTKLAFSDDTKGKFEAMRWQHILVKDGNDLVAIQKAIKKAKREVNKPSIIEVKTVIGYGTNLAGTSKVHGAAIGEGEAELLRQNLGWEYPPFEIPSEIYNHYRRKVTLRGQRVHRRWKKLLSAYGDAYPEEAKLLESFVDGHMTVNLNDYQHIMNVEKEATRATSGKMINALSTKYLNLIGGSADLTASTKAKGAEGDYDKDHRLARNINFGVREHAMGAIANGMVLHGGLKVFTGAFFVFSDYMKPAIRLAAIMQIPTIFVFSHDTIAVGEDGPTHEPVEQLAGLRSIPGLNVIRPADAREVAAAWKVAIESTTTPTVIILTRQGVQNHTSTNYEGLIKGAYIVSPEKEKIDGVFLAAGSEVNLAIEAKKILTRDGKDIRVISMPSHYFFDKQTKQYQKEILPRRAKVVAVEMGSRQSWYKYTKDVYGLDEFGISAPMDVALTHYHFTPEDLADYAKKIFK